MTHELQHYNKNLQRVLWWSLLSGMVSLVALTVFISGPEIERRLFPVHTDWTVLEQMTLGRDLVISGTMIKRRHCAYIPGPIARDENGQNFYVESASATAAISWAADDKPQNFGPWTIRDGAGRKLTLFQQHKCHILWPTFTKLGVVDARTSRVQNP